MKYTDADLLTLTEGTPLLDPTTGFAYRVGAPVEMFGHTADGEFTTITRPMITGHEKGSYGWGGSSTGYKVDAFAELYLIVAWAPLV